MKQDSEIAQLTDLADFLGDHASDSGKALAHGVNADPKRTRSKTLVHGGRLPNQRWPSRPFQEDIT